MFETIKRIIQNSEYAELG